MRRGRHSLPIAAPLPTADAMRRKLGGRASTERDVGAIVAVATSAGLSRRGVVVFARGEEVDVWFSELGGLRQLVQRTKRDSVTPAEAADGERRELEAVSRDARTFALLEEGSRVCFFGSDGAAKGRIVEKCRYGALVASDDGRVVGVGFRRLAADPGGDN